MSQAVKDAIARRAAERIEELKRRNAAKPAPKVVGTIRTHVADAGEPSPIRSTVTRGAAPKVTEVSTLRVGVTKATKGGQAA